MRTLLAAALLVALPGCEPSDSSSSSADSLDQNAAAFPVEPAENSQPPSLQSETNDNRLAVPGAAGTETSSSHHPCFVQNGERLPDVKLRAVGTEPFWGAKIEGRCVTYSHPEDQAGTRIWTRFSGSAEAGQWTGNHGGRPFVLRTQPQADCSDGMSDRRYPIAVTLTVSGEERKGCANQMRRFRHLAGAALIAILSLTPASAGNPFVTNQFVADPSARVFGDRVYVYFTNDSGNDGKYWNGRDWRLFSSANLIKWRDHGSIFSIDGFKWAKELAWAPGVTHRNGNFYLYLPVDRTKIGVARAKSPTGPFTDAIGKPLIDKARDANVGDEPIDPEIFIDGDGQAYMYFGTRKPKVVKLNRDMTSLAGPIQDVTITDAKVPYGEAPWLHKRGGIYYFSYSTGWPGQIAYATGASPAGPFKQHGIIFDRVNLMTNHHAIVQKAGKWYFFYHNNSLPGGGDHKRSPNVDRLYYNADGTIRRVVPTKAGITVPALGR